MKPILLIEDRLRRLQNYNQNLENNKLIEVITEVKYDKILEKFENKSLDYLAEYKVIISHKSALSSKYRDDLKDICKMNNIALVFFSGGISFSFLEDSLFPYLNINARDFYSEKLELFLEEIEKGSINLNILQFGNNWRVNKILNIRNDINKKKFENSSLSILDLGVDDSLKRELIEYQPLIFLQKEEFYQLKNNETKDLLNYLEIILQKEA